METSRDAITRFLFVKDAPAPVDLAVVLGSRKPATMDPAIELYRRGWAPYLLVTGHGPHPEGPNECEGFCAYAVENGVPEGRLLREPCATNTKENFLFSHSIVQQALGWERVQRVALIGKPFHGRRALMTARRYWPEHVSYLFLPSELPDDLHPDSWWESEWGRRRVFEELRRIGEYAAAGDLSEL